MVRALIEIGEHGFTVTVLKPDADVPLPSVADQATDPTLGLMAASSSTDTFARAINELFALGTGKAVDGSAFY